MPTRDSYQTINELDEPTVQSMIEWMEFRGTDPTFNGMREAYFDKLPLPLARTILELGCGTGVVARALLKREDFSDRVIGMDHSPAMTAAARKSSMTENKVEIWLTEQR